MKSFRLFLEELKKLGPRLGSNEGGIHSDEHGTKYYIKHYKNPEQAKSEVLAGKLYKHMGIPTAEPELHGTHSVKTKWNDDLEHKSSKDFADISKKHAHQLGKIYHAGILTKNWDILGPHDLGNVMHNKKTGNLHAIDHGGAFHFRAQGGHKDYGPDIDEKHSLLADHGYKSAELFKHAFKTHPSALKHGKEAVSNLDDEHVKHLFKNSGLKNWKDLHKNFHARKTDLLKD